MKFNRILALCLTLMLSVGLYAATVNANESAHTGASGGYPPCFWMPLSGDAQEIFAARDEYKSILNETMAQLAQTVSQPAFGTVSGDWTVLSLARGGYFPLDDPYFSGYLTRAAETVKTLAESVDQNGALHKTKSTENARLILTLSALGVDLTDFGGVDLIGAYDANGFAWITKQGLNGPIFALLALGTKEHPVTDGTLREACLDYILPHELATGGWTLYGTAAAPDLSAMALQALAHDSDNAAVAAVAARGFDVLSEIQRADGNFPSRGGVSTETVAQVIIACTAWGIDPDTDPRFVKEHGSALDALLTFYVEDGHGFAHAPDSSGNGYTVDAVNQIATDQACCALVAYDRLINGKCALYDMRDVVTQPARITPSAQKLYVGDGVDLIPADKRAIVVAMPGIGKTVTPIFHDGTYTVALRYSPCITEKNGIPSFVVLVDASVSIGSFCSPDNYTVIDDAPTSLTFGDVNGDGRINAQDALSIVNMWLRRTESPSDDTILAADVNGDGRIHTSDALSVVAYFVDGRAFDILTAAAPAGTGYQKTQGKEETA